MNEFYSPDNLLNTFGIMREYSAHGGIYKEYIINWLWLYLNEWQNDCTFLKLILLFANSET